MPTTLLNTYETKEHSEQKYEDKNITKFRLYCSFIEQYKYC